MPLRDNHRFAPRASVLCILLFAASAGFAADAPTKDGKDAKDSSFGTPKATGPFLTKEQLRTCLARQEKTRGQDAELVKEQAAIGVEKDLLTRVGDDLKARLEAVDRSSADAVAAYNEAVQARDRQIDAYQARVDAFNARVGANQAEREAFGQGCSNRRFLVEDEEAIRKGK